MLDANAGVSRREVMDVKGVVLMYFCMYAEGILNE
jgi:hypothetical protein